MKGSTLPRNPTIPEPPKPLNESEMLTKFGVKDRSSFERKMQAWESKADLSLTRRWRRLAGVLLALAPLPVKFSGTRTIQCFIADGKYRKQVFALNGTEEGQIIVSGPDVITAAVRAGVLSKAQKVEDKNVYPIPDSSDTLAIASLDSKSPQLEDFVRDMTGWNRKAMQITLPIDATETQVRTAEILCALAAAEWATKVAT